MCQSDIETCLRFLLSRLPLTRDNFKAKPHYVIGRRGPEIKKKVAANRNAPYVNFQAVLAGASL